MTVTSALDNQGGSTNLVTSGNVVLANDDNQYSGTTNVSSGMLEVPAPDSLPGYNTTNSISVASGATLAVVATTSGASDIGPVEQR